MNSDQLGLSLGACDHCSRIKQLCDGEEPCWRCARLSISCQRYTRSHKVGHRRPLADTDGLSTHNVIVDDVHIRQPAKRRAVVIKRTRNGCMSCKRRKKKCDEAFPKCGDCKRLNLACYKAFSKERANFESPPSFSQSPRDSHRDNLTNSIENIEVLSPELAGGSSDSWSSDRHCFPTTLLDPVCDNHTMIKSARIIHDLKNATPYSSLYSIAFKSPFPTSQPKDQHLIRHFIRVVSRTLSVIHEDEVNPFLSLVVPLAGSSRVVMESLLALSASHLRRTDPDILQIGLSHQNEAIRSLNDIISTNNSGSPEEMLATVLLLCMIEMRDGSSTKWSWHISAAKTIIRSKRRIISSTTWNFLLTIFGYVDSVMTISKCQGPLITLEELAEEGDQSDESTIPCLLPAAYTSHKAALFGVALPLFSIIGKISALASKRKDRVDEVSEAWFRQSAARIEKSLRDWDFDHRNDNANLSLGDRRNCKDLVLAAYAIRWASILRLHQVVEGYNRTDPCVQECTQHILDSISQIRYGSSVEGILLFSLVMAASGCIDDKQRTIVRERWMVIERTIGFDNVYHAREMIEAVWKAADEGRKDGTYNDGLSVNWAQIRYFNFPGVVLL